jgi:hypothetical protein
MCPAIHKSNRSSCVVLRWLDFAAGPCVAERIWTLPTPVPALLSLVFARRPPTLPQKVYPELVEARQHCSMPDRFSMLVFVTL